MTDVGVEVLGALSLRNDPLVRLPQEAAWFADRGKSRQVEWRETEPTGLDHTNQWNQVRQSQTRLSALLTIGQTMPWI